MEFVKIISSEGHIFIVERKYAEVSQTIKIALSSSYKEGSSKEFSCPEISAKTIEKVIQYFHYKVKYTNTNEPIPEFPITPEEVLDLAKASHYLLC